MSKIFELVKGQGEVIQSYIHQEKTIAAYLRAIHKSKSSYSSWKEIWYWYCVDILLLIKNAAIYCIVFIYADIDTSILYLLIWIYFLSKDSIRRLIARIALSLSKTNVIESEWLTKKYWLQEKNLVLIRVLFLKKIKKKY